MIVRLYYMHSQPDNLPYNDLFPTCTLGQVTHLDCNSLWLLHLELRLERNGVKQWHGGRELVIYCPRYSRLNGAQRHVVCFTLNKSHLWG